MAAPPIRFSLRIVLIFLLAIRGEIIPEIYSEVIGSIKGVPVGSVVVGTLYFCWGSTCVGLGA